VKVGADNQKKVIAAIALGVIAVAVFAYEFSGWFGGSSSSAAAPAPTAATDLGKEPARTLRNTGRTRSTNTKKSAAQSLDPTLRLDLLKSSEDTKYEGTGRNIFKVFVVIPPIITPPVPRPGPSPGPVAVAPPPPPSNLKFYGFAAPQGGVKRVFLIKNEDVFVAKEGEIVDRRYKVVRISPNSVEILDVLSNNRENIPLTQG
jgi:hypothetical protein